MAKKAIKQKITKKKSIVRKTMPVKKRIVKPKPVSDKTKLTPKQKAFCREYVIDWNGSRAYKVAYPKIKEENARIRASVLLTNINIQSYCEDIQKDLEKLCGISKSMIINEHKKLAFSSIAHLHNTWIELRQFELLTQEQKDCIAEIDTKTERKYFAEYDPDKEDFVKVPYDVKYIKIKLYDKQKSLDSISKLYGYEAPNKTELTGKDGKDLIPARTLTKEEAQEFLSKLENGC